MPSPVDEPATPAPDKGALLIVDDTPDNLQLLSFILSKQGYKIRLATGGEPALKAVQADAPDLILLDLMMPDIDGYEVCRRLKADAQTASIPVVFLSALGAPEDKIKAFAAGGVDYIAKPFHAGEVVARVTTHLRLRELQKQLEEANRALEQQVQELDAFAHTVAHDLKAPLAIVTGCAELLVRHGDTMEAQELQQVAQATADSTYKAVDIIDNLLLLASAHKISVELQPLDMASIVKGARGRLANVIAAYQAEIMLPDTNAWPQALGHAPWVEAVWANYLSNALKYGGRPPRVELGATGRPDHTVLFWVRDNGAGLSVEEQGRLFIPFTQLHHTRVEGYGLGLSIVRRIVEKLGGQVGVKSPGKPGQGSVFYFTLPGITGGAVPAPKISASPGPASQVLARPRPEPGRSEPESLHILLVDDSRLAREMTLRLLAHMGYRAEAVGSGAEALNALRQQPVDVVLMDVRMPGMNGLETTRAIRRDWPPDRQPRIIAMTADTTAQDRAACLAAGMDDHIGKPVQIAELQSALERRAKSSGKDEG